MRSPEEVRIGHLALPGQLRTGSNFMGLVVFVHGSGSSRLSPRNAYVATALNKHRLATLLFDLLTDTEAADRGKVFDIELLTSRLCEALTWVGTRRDLAGLRLGLFGASTGAAAALSAAARQPERVAAVVSRGGRPDLATGALARVQAPTLLIVGAGDHEVLRLNRIALQGLQCGKRLEVVPGATHLFEEPGALAVVAALAGKWFTEHLVRPHL
jgi:putative phosphoribosyl transferase